MRHRKLIACLHPSGRCPNPVVTGSDSLQELMRKTRNLPVQAYLYLLPSQWLLRERNDATAGAADDGALLQTFGLEPRTDSKPDSPFVKHERLMCVRRRLPVWVLNSPVLCALSQETDDYGGMLQSIFQPLTLRFSFITKEEPEVPEDSRKRG